jgi:hypothetical protein
MPCPAGYQNCAGIGTDYTQINEAIPPADGNGLYYGYGALGYVFIVNQQPIQIVRLQFKVLESFVQTEVKVLPEYNTVIENKTVIYGSNIPGLSVLGTITDAVIFGTPAPAGDFNGDGVVGSEDMAALLGNWGALSFKNNPYDLDGDGVVGAGDLAILVSNWS